MNKLSDLFASVKKSFSTSRIVTYDDLGVTIVIEPVTSMEEIKILEACKIYDGAAYIEALKKHTLAFSIKKINDISFTDPDIEYEDDTGKKVTESTYLFMLGKIDTWSSTLIDSLFEAFNNMQVEIEYKIKTKVKFDRFTVQPEPEETKPVEATPAGIPSGFKVIKEGEGTAEPLDETEVINRVVKEEQAQAQAEIDAKR